MSSLYTIEMNTLMAQDEGTLVSISFRIADAQINFRYNDTKSNIEGKILNLSEYSLFFLGSI